MRLSSRLSATLAGGLLLAGLATAAEIHTLRSGNGAAGGPDAQLRCLPLTLDTEYNTPLTAGDFAAAQAAAPPMILTTLNGAWGVTLPADALAQWVSDSIWGWSGGSTCLYAIDFTVSAATVVTASLDFHFLCDNWLGEVYLPVNEGLYLNGISIAGTSGGNYATQTSFTGVDVSALVNPGLNTLYILSTDVGGPGGLNFSATLTINGDGTTGADDRPVAFGLGDSYPNPFNPSTTIPFTLAETGEAELAVYNMLGNRVAVLHSGLAERGTHEATFDASALPSGVYFARLSAEGRVDTRKLVLVK